MKKTRLGRLVKVKNLKRNNFSTEKESYVAVLVKNEDGSNERCILLTDAELHKAEQRAIRNPEDNVQKSFYSSLID
jgi:hypothetical protein